MAHKPRWKNGGISRSGLLFALLIAAVGTYFFDELDFFTSSENNLQKLVDESELKSKSFDVDIKEIVAPKTKIKAYLLENKTNPIISFSFLFKGAGSVADIDERRGVANFAVSMLGEGTENISSLDFKQELEKRGIHMSFLTNIDDIKGTVVSSKKYFDDAALFLRDTLKNPRLEEKDIERIRAQILAVLEKQQENPVNVLNLARNEMLYGIHPYGQNPLGNKKNILSLKKGDLLDVIEQRLAKDNIIIGIAGDVSVDEAKHYIDKIFDFLPDKSYLPYVREIKPVLGIKKHLQRDLKQNIAVFSGVGTKRDTEDFYPLYMANYIFGGAGLNSRLSQAVREKEGLVYSIYSYISIDDKSPLLNISFSSTKENYAKVMILLEQESENMNNGISQKELNMAKDYLISSYNLRFADIDGISDMLVYMQKDNLGLDFLQKRNEYVANVSLEDVNKAAKKYFNIKHMSVIDIGK